MGPNSGSLKVIISQLILGDKLGSNGTIDKELRVAWRELDCFWDYARPIFSPHFSYPFFQLNPKQRALCVKEGKRLE